MKIQATTITKNISINNSIRRIFYQGQTTLDDMTQERMQATIFDAIRYLSKPYKKANWLTKKLMGIKNSQSIEKETIPQIEKVFKLIPDKKLCKLQKALVIIEDTKKQNQKIYQDSCNYYNDIVDIILNKIVFK